MSKKVITIAFMFILCVTAGFLIYNSDAMKQARLVDALVARNIAARGGAEAWQNVTSLKMTGRMDLGQEMVVPYVIEQKRPGKMCFEFVFDDKTAVQCSDGNTGWRIAPFRGRNTPQPMTSKELRETADSSDLYGLLYNYEDRGTDIELIGHETIEGRDTIKLKLILKRGGVRWVYLDVETALEIKTEAMHTVAGHERRVETVYSDWQAQDGLLIARRQETKTEGDSKSHFLTVENVSVNPPIDDSRFAMPVTASNSQDSPRKTSL